MIQQYKTCSFTGHRPRSFSFGYQEESEEFKALRVRIKNTLIQICNCGCRTFYCGMAEGVDLWCGEIILEIKDQFDPPLEICAVVPYLDQPKGMSHLNQERYRSIMEAAKERYLVANQFTKSCFQKRNRYLVDSCDVLLAVYREGEERSGTAQTIRMARRKGKKIFLINA